MNRGDRAAAATAEGGAKVLAKGSRSPDQDTLVLFSDRLKLPPPAAADTEHASSSRTGCVETSIPGFSASVPRMKSEFFGLMQNSSTLILPLGATPCRTRKVRTLSGTGSLLEKNESENSCRKSRCNSSSAPRGSTITRPVLSSTKNGTCMHSAATLTHCLLLPLCFHSQTIVRK